MRTVSNDQFMEMFAKRLYFDLIADAVGLEDPWAIFAEVKRLVAADLKSVAGQ